MKQIETLQSKITANKELMKKTLEKKERIEKQLNNLEFKISKQEMQLQILLKKQPEKQED